MSLPVKPSSPFKQGSGLLAPVVVMSCLGASLCSLDSALNVAFPALIEHFRLAPRHLALVVVLYHIPIAILTLAGGITGDRLGHTRVFTAGIVVTGLAFPLCGLAPTYAWLLFGRVLQGIGAGLVFGTAPALITLAVTDEHRGPGLGTLNLATGTALALAPPVAGILIELSGWRSTFLFRAPLALGLLLVLMLTSFPREDVLAAGIHSRRLVPRLSAPLVISSAVTLLANSAFIVLYVVGPLYLADVLRVSPASAGFLFMLVPLGSALGGLLSGSYVRRRSPWGLAGLALALEASGLALLGLSSSRPSALQTGVGFALAGLGVGAFQVPNMTAVMNLVPDANQGFGGGLISAMRTLGIVSGAILAPWLLESRQALYEVNPPRSSVDGPSPHASFVTAFSDVLLTAAGVALVALFLAWTLALLTSGTRRRR